MPEPTQTASPLGDMEMMLLRVWNEFGTDGATSIQVMGKIRDNSPEVWIVEAFEAFRKLDEQGMIENIGVVPSQGRTPELQIRRLTAKGHIALLNKTR